MFVVNWILTISGQTMHVLGQEIHKMVEYVSNYGKNSVVTFRRNFAVYVKQRYGPVILHQSVIAFQEYWRDSGIFPVS